MNDLKAEESMKSLKFYVPLWVHGGVGGGVVQRFRGFFKAVSDSERLKITALEMLPIHLNESIQHIFIETYYVRARCVLSPGHIAMNSRQGPSY